jgi:glyoxylase-like metal-dependent hydrolase (beta-lactamase superfamily II)
MIAPRSLTALLIILCALPLAYAQAPEPNGGGVVPGVLPEHWNPAGPKCMEIADWQIHEYNKNLYMIRQSGCLDYEKPFLYLLFGKDKALLLDTGSRKFPVTRMLDEVIGRWLVREKRAGISLIVAHSHAHSDHTAGDTQIKTYSNPSIAVSFVPAEIEATKQLYGIREWPTDVGSLDLGDRVIDAIPIPGHNAVSIALYDRQTGILFTGDSFYPGRLYIQDFEAFVKSTNRLVAFTKGKIVSHIVGCHIEQTSTPYVDYPVGTIYQPNEHSMALARGHLLELQDALLSLQGKPARLAMRDFTIWPAVHDAQLNEAAEAAFKAREKRQMEQMWDQPKP